MAGGEPYQCAPLASNRLNRVCCIQDQEIAFGGGTKLSAEDGFLQYMIGQLQTSAPAEESREEDAEEDGDHMKLTSLQSITDFMTCAGRTLPDNIRLWAEETWRLPIP